MNSRAIACQNISNIVNCKASLLTLDANLQKLDISAKDKSFIKALCYDFFRYYYSLEQTVKPYINKKTKLKAKLLIMLGTLQILEMGQPDYAVINESVNACKNLKIEWAKGLVNATLRNIIANKDSIRITFDKLKDYDLPDWITKKLKKQYPKDYKDIFIASNKKAPMFIRLNQQKDIQQVYDYLSENNISFQKTGLENCIKLNTPIDVKNNELFEQAFFTVQDKSAQFAGHIIPLQDNDKVLDACAAPGGKTTHLLEQNANIELTAIDLVDTRLKLLKNNITRFNATNNINILKHDLTKKLDSKFDKIILDAPCSALGVVRRNPDIKILRSEADVQNIIKLQSKILQNLWDNSLNIGGSLLYITCSILEEENENQISNFLAKNSNAQVQDIGILNDKFKEEYGYQILPSENEGDGFYYCLINKV